MSESDRTSPAEAKTQHRWWPGWIWAVPIAAFGIGVWLLVRALTQSGTDITITFTDVHGIDPQGTDIMYRGLKVGSVTEASLMQDCSAVQVSATIQDSAAPLLKTGTVFWLQGATPSLNNLSSLGAIVSGPTIMMEPGSGEPTTHFNGLMHRPLPDNHGPPALFTVSFEGAVGDLSQGDTVKVRGFSVGEVKEISFHYDVETGKVDTPVTVALYPALFHMQGTMQPESADALRAALKRSVEEGLRARLEREPPLIGGYRVTLEMEPNAPAADLNLSNNIPEIPTAPDNGLESVVTRFKNIPIDQIAQHILAITKHVDTLISSPKLKDSVAQADASIRKIHEVMNHVGPEVDKLVHSLHQTAQQLEQTAKAADKSLGGAPSQTGLNDTLQEIKEAARSVRSFADYLDRHPEALISGKPGE